MVDRCLVSLAVLIVLIGDLGCQRTGESSNGFIPPDGAMAEAPPSRGGSGGGLQETGGDAELGGDGGANIEGGFEDVGSDGAVEGGGGHAGGAIEPIDLRQYFPSTTTVVRTRHHDGVLYGTYTYFPASADFVFLYDHFFSLGISGDLFVWGKGYGTEGCTATYAHLFLGDDGSFTEVGDYLATDQCHPSVAFGYGAAQTSANDGLAWAAAGGLPLPGGNGQPAVKEGLRIRAQNQPGAPYLDTPARAWNRTVVVERLPTFRPAHGRSPQGDWGKNLGKTYDDVLRVVFYHGTWQPHQEDIVCPTDDAWAYSGLYEHHAGYHSYASELYLAPGRWIIQETFLFTESGSYWGMPNCVGLSLDKNPLWTVYIDDP
ncbi:MAG TPA: hypothetical protein PK140_05015 [Polyangiaceae bacterium]|jgi:hypothetical protein|nr:MAG: hypothetical protein BWY17_01218 [Deltaproteobacteria bacterium ADurb.Bin207]HQF24311.1 hypothetical protein [Polyangiaceae bacterium]HQM08734.1 hypothetical protein [Polyangiaceae bacterium]